MITEINELGLQDNMRINDTSNGNEDVKMTCICLNL